MATLEAALRRRDTRVVLALHAVLRDGFATRDTLGHLLQVPAAEALQGLEVSAACQVSGRPALRPGENGVWLPGTGVVEQLTADVAALSAARGRGLITWWRPEPTHARALVQRYLAAVGRISSGDVANLTGLTPTAGRALLVRLEEAGLLRRGGSATRGRNVHYVAADGGADDPLT